MSAKSLLLAIILSIFSIKSQSDNGRVVTLSPTSPSKSPTTNTPTITITSNPCQFTDGCNHKNITNRPSSSPTEYNPNSNARNNATLPPTSSPITIPPTPHTTAVHNNNDNTNISSLSPTLSPSLNINNTIVDGRNSNMTQIPTINTNSPTTPLPTMPAKKNDIVPTFQPTTNPTIYPSITPSVYPSTSPTVTPILSTINPTITPTMYNVGEVTEAETTNAIDSTGPMGGERQQSETSIVSTITMVIVGVIIGICMVIGIILCIKYNGKGKVKHEMVHAHKNQMAQCASNKDSNEIQGETESDESAINMMNKLDDDRDGDMITIVNETEGQIVIASDDNDEDIIEVVNETDKGDIDEIILENNKKEIKETDDGYDMHNIEMNELSDMITPQLDMNGEDLIEDGGLDIDSIDTIQ